MFKSHIEHTLIYLDGVALEEREALLWADAQIQVAAGHTDRHRLFELTLFFGESCANGGNRTPTACKSGANPELLYYLRVGVGSFIAPVAHTYPLGMRK